MKILYILFIAIQIFATEYDTPLNNVYISYFKENITPYQRYAKYFLDKNGDIKNILEKDDSLLQLNEKTLSFMYDYHILNTNKAFFKINNLFEYNSDKFINSFEGIFIQDVYLRENNLKMAKKILTFNFCETLEYKVDKIACMSNNITINCLDGLDYKNELSILIKENINAAKYSLNFCNIQKK